MTEKKTEESTILIGPDMMQDIWEIVRSNRAAGKPSMARVYANSTGGAIRVEEIKIPKKEERDHEAYGEKDNP